jgi:uncharacterized phage infection (PIP) family protein YhgE
MKPKLLIKILGLTGVLLVWLTGCTVPPAPANQPVMAASATAPGNFQEPSSRSPNAVQSAINLSQKVAEQSEQLSTLQQVKQSLTSENEQFKTQIAELEPMLQQAQKELSEANDLLMEMRLELNNWQNNILGFQSEMRESDQAQLDALLKILQLLGGEIITNTPDTVDDQNNSKVSDSNV